MSKRKRSSEKGVHFDEKAENQKKCHDGPNVIFGKKDLPFFKYLENISSKGSLGCPSDKYPKYTDGKYCCVDEKSTDQEQFDFINYLLEQAEINVGDTAFGKNNNIINFLIKKRKQLITRASFHDNELKDSWEHGDVDVWFKKRQEEAAKISKHRPDHDSKGGYKKSKKNKSKKSLQLSNKKSKTRRKKI